MAHVFHHTAMLFQAISGSSHSSHSQSRQIMGNRQWVLENNSSEAVCTMGSTSPWVVQRLLRFNSSATMEGLHTTHRRVKSVVSRPLLDERVVEGRARVVGVGRGQSQRSERKHS